MSDIGGKKACMKCDSDRNIGYIEGILDNILIRLHIKDILRFKSISQLWYGLTSDARFTRTHFSRSLETPKLIVCLYNDNHDSELYLIERNNRTTPLLGLPEFASNSSFKMISSFNGLIVGTYLGTNEELDINIFNPVTRESQVLPVGTPSAVAPSVGVVFDLENFRYKILRFYRDTLEGQNGNHKCEIYTPDTGAWRGVDDVMQCPVGNLAFPLCASNVCVGGRMYWLVWSKDDRTIPDHILSVDMEDNFTQINLPDDKETFNLLTFLVENEGRLILIGVDDTEMYLCIWSYNHNESSWTYMGAVRPEQDTNFDIISSITSIKNEILFVVKNWCTENYRFCVLNLHDLTWRNLQVPRKFETCDAVVALPFAESLFKCDMTN